MGMTVRLCVKRGLDVMVATSGLLVLAPVLAWVALAVAVTQGLPILFRQERPGLHGRPFTILKFRTMRAPRADEVWYLTDGSRITRLGRFLRATSLDELPELWNVLRGDMSLVALARFSWSTWRRTRRRSGDDTTCGRASRAGLS